MTRPYPEIYFEWMFSPVPFFSFVFPSLSFSPLFPRLEVAAQIQLRGLGSAVSSPREGGERGHKRIFMHLHVELREHVW